MNKITIRRVTTSDKESVLAMRDNTTPGPDSLPAYFDYYATIPNAYPAALFYDGNLAAFLVGHVVDNGRTCVLRAGRVATAFEGHRLISVLSRHVTEDGHFFPDVGSIVSLSDEIPGNTGTRRAKRYDKIVFTWRWAHFTLCPGGPYRYQEDKTAVIENVSDKTLSTIFNNRITRDYVAPKGVMLVHWTPLKPLAENIPTIRGVEGSTNIYSDLKPVPDGCTGLLTCCTKYKAARESKLDYIFCLDIFGTDLSSLKMHLITHLNDMNKTTETLIGLKIVVPEGIQWKDVDQGFTELGVEMAKGAEFFKVNMHEWWRSPKSAKES